MSEKGYSVVSMLLVVPLCLSYLGYVQAVCIQYTCGGDIPHLAVYFVRSRIPHRANIFNLSD